MFFSFFLLFFFLFQILKSNEGKEWYRYVDGTITQDLLEKLSTEFEPILGKPSFRPKRKSVQNEHPSKIRKTPQKGDVAIVSGT